MQHPYAEVEIAEKLLCLAIEDSGGEACGVGPGEVGDLNRLSGEARGLFRIAVKACAGLSHQGGGIRGAPWSGKGAGHRKDGQQRRQNSQ